MNDISAEELPPLFYLHKNLDKGRDWWYNKLNNCSHFKTIKIKTDPKKGDRHGTGKKRIR